jgi:SAM-dependent methyltransferase
MSQGQYVIRGGAVGRERLRLLAGVLRPTTLALFERAGVRSGMMCIDAGCGGGDVSFDLARLVAPGRVVGIDPDEAKLELAREEAATLQLSNLDFGKAGVFEIDGPPTFDVVYMRFLLTHLPDPASALQKMKSFLKPGGLVIVEDIDFRGHFCYPDCPAFRRFVELYRDVVKKNGGDPDIGPRLPRMLLDLGLENVNLNVIQPAGLTGDVKMVAPITMENISLSVIAAGLAMREYVEHVIAELTEYANDPRTLMSLPRIVQTWGRVPDGTQ